MAEREQRPLVRAFAGELVLLVSILQEAGRLRLLQRGRAFRHDYRKQALIEQSGDLVVNGDSGCPVLQLTRMLILSPLTIAFIDATRVDLAAQVAEVARQAYAREGLGWVAALHQAADEQRLNRSLEFAIHCMTQIQLEHARGKLEGGIQTGVVESYKIELSRINQSRITIPAFRSGLSRFLGRRSDGARRFSAIIAANVLERRSHRAYFSQHEETDFYQA
jgi:hypothetical protein